MKFWKNWPYWLRGGVVAVCIVIIVFLFAFTCDGAASKYDSLCSVIPYWPLVQTITLIISILGDAILVLGNIGLSLLIILVWFIFGALIGLFISWLKKRKQRKLNQI